jgi:peptidyl-prolyl cis-trans isomerase D
MRQMRQNTKWIMGLTAVFFVGFMAFQGVLSLTGRGSGGGDGSVLGRVNGEQITATEYDNTYRSLMAQQQQQMNGQRITSVMQKQIENSAWEQVIAGKLLQQELKRRGIRVTDEEIKQAAMYAPPEDFKSNAMFQTNGQFDQSKYQAFMASPAADDQLLGQLEAYYRDIIPRSKLYFESTAGTYITDGQLWRIYSDQNEKISAKFVVIDPANVVPTREVTVTDAQVKDYYNAHRDEFPRAGHATVKYVVMDRTPSAQDSAAARTKAMDARQRLLGGATFADVAKSIATDSARGAQRTELTVTHNSQLPPSFEQAAFSLPIGKISDLLSTQFGYHVIRVKSRTDSSAVTEQVLVPVELAQASEDALLDRADSLEELGSTIKIDAAAKKLGLTARTAELTPPIAFIPGVGVPDEGMAWAFDDAKVGDVSSVFEAPKAYYMLELVARTDSGTLSLAEAKPNIQRMLIEREQLRRAQQKATTDIAGKDLNAIASMYKTTVGEATNFARGDEVPGLGRLNIAVGAAFGLKPGQMSSVIPAGGRLFVIQNTNHFPADTTAFEAQKQQQRNSVMQALADQKWQQFVEALRKNAKVVDNRKALRTAGQRATGA